MHRHHRHHRSAAEGGSVASGRSALTMFVAVALIASALVAAVGQATAVQPEVTGRQHGADAIAALGTRLPAVARANGLDPQGLRDLLLADDTLAVDSNDQLLYIDHRAPGEPALGEASTTSAAAPPVTDPAFFLHSRPGAAHTIYLDFDGHTAEGTSWNSSNPSITTGPYNTDGNPDVWSSGELSVIRQTWEIVSEDFSPFDVNVTTEEPGTEALRRSGSGDGQWGVRVVITPDDWNNCGCGGFAYIGAFDDFADEPAYVFNSSLLGVSEASTHEVGHTLGLAHDGLASGTAYYQGHGSGEAAWAPLMGASYYKSVTQWSRGEYFGANNNGSSANYGAGPDDLAIVSSLTNGNGFGYRGDDHANATAAGTALSGTTMGAGGVIERTTDVDVFTFTTGSGAVTIQLAPAPNRPNLNIAAELRSSTGAVVASSSPTSGLGAGFSMTLAAGTYHVVVSGTGAGSPLSSSPSGYTDYASLGQYTLTGTVQPVDPGDVTPPLPPTNLAASAAEGSVTLTWTPGSEADLATHTVHRAAVSGSGYAPLATLGAATASFVDTSVGADTTYYYVVTSADLSGNVSTASTEASATTPAPPPPPPPPPAGPDHVSADVITTYGTASGTFAATAAAGGATQTFTETHAGGRPSQRHDRLEHIWSLPVTGGNHLLHVVASSAAAGDADAGVFDIAWSTSASGPWQTVLDVRPGDSEQVADLGTVSGTVYLRLTDRNRTSGNNSNDSISVDHIYLDGGQPPTAPPGQVSSPTPASGAAGIALSPLLSWSPGDGATTHQPWLAAPGAAFSPLGSPSISTSVQTGPLLPNTTYTWRVDSINALGTTQGPIWTFTTGDTPAGPTAVVIDSVALSSVSAGKGNRFGQATVTILDDQGAPVGQVTVTGRFTGDVASQPAGVATDASGTALLTSTVSAKKPSFGFCVVSVTGGLPLDTVASAGFLCTP